MPYDQIGKLLLVGGAALLAVGLLFLLLGRTPFGKLPGDISFTTGPLTCVAPLATMLLLSVLLTVIVNVVLRIFNR